MSGLSQWVADLLTPLGDLPVLATIAIACIIVTTVTEVTSNAATITIFLPILSALVGPGCPLLVPLAWSPWRVCVCVCAGGGHPGEPALRPHPHHAVHLLLLPPPGVQPAQRRGLWLRPPDHHGHGETGAEVRGQRPALLTVSSTRR